ncbi:hypothetical protein, conserved [Babesia ovata]|uniref:6-Cys domain-containing protein n=1 Tax=Babesia ovata TaxID=189622 RepID=A0A2H6K6Y9_9APIC|nr:uncharacterized protein BOVATA_002570 [Babesia ovata]GBE58764.1 hypothetical protein, conserved [Babesia ovata]
MAKFSITRCLWALCAIFSCCIWGINAIECDFGNPFWLLGRNALVGCHMDMDIMKTETVICPRRVDGSEYMWHPQRMSGDNAQVNAYVSSNGKLSSAAHSDVMLSESNNPLFWIESNQLQTELHVNLPSHGYFAINERRLIFICGPRDLVLSDTLQGHLGRLDASIEMQTFPWAPSTPLTQEIAKIGSGLGVLFLNRGRLHMPLQGCGGRPSPLFSPDNEVTVDPVTGTRSCVVDPMSESPIGFLCEGRVEPKECMKSLIEESGRIITAPPPHSYWDIQNDGHLVVAKYFDQLALPPISGKCRCIDPETGQVKAKIEIRSKTDYVCDISSMIERNSSQPIGGPWCSVVLQPGSTLTIRFPAEDVGTEPSEKDSPPGMPPQKRPKYVFDTGFMPKDLATLRQLASVYGFDIYDQISYHDALVGDALELDVSQMHRGEVKLKYHSGKPLALRSGLNSFHYHWTFISGDKNVAKTIRAMVELSFAFTHPYHVPGCDRGTQGVFDPQTNGSYCSTISMGNDIWNTYECVYDVQQVRLAGIHCGPDEELFPANCESKVYDLYSNKIIARPESIKTATLIPIQGFQLFELVPPKTSPLIKIGMESTPHSYACFCVDQRGYETSRLILGHTNHMLRRYITRNIDRTLIVARMLYTLWKTADLILEESTPTRLIMAPKTWKNSVSLEVGKRLTLGCLLGAYDRAVYEGLMPNLGWPSTTWLPKQPDIFYYAINQTLHGDHLVPKRYKDAIAAAPGGFKVFFKDLVSTQRHQRLIIESRSDSIVVSKDPLHNQYVPMTFVCGKELEPADVSIIAGQVPTSPTTHIVRSSVEYSWDVVQVNVETTDPYMQGCGVTYESTDLFKPETPQLYDGDGQSQFGCNIDLNAAKEAAFYCPAPYVLDPPNCFSQVLVDGEVTNIGELSKSLVASRSNHFVILSFDSSLVGVGETLRQAPPLECRCVTVKGIVLSTIQIENYYSN